MLRNPVIFSLGFEPGSLHISPQLGRICHKIVSGLRVRPPTQPADEASRTHRTVPVRWVHSFLVLRLIARGVLHKFANSVRRQCQLRETWLRAGKGFDLIEQSANGGAMLRLPGFRGLQFKRQVCGL